MKLGPPKTPNRLADRILATSVSLSTLARQTGAERQEIHKLFHGERRLTQPWAERLAPHLGITWWELLGAPGTGLADSGHRPIVAPTLDGNAFSLPNLDDPAEDADYDTLAAAAQAMLTEEGQAMPPATFARLMLHLWQEFQDIGNAIPADDRIRKIVERRRLMIRVAARHATGPYRRP